MVTLIYVDLLLPDLFNCSIPTECLFTITPIGEVYMPRLLLNITKMEGISTTVQTIGANDQIVNAVITFMIRSTAELVNNSHCHITSLEAYRGKEQAIEINHGASF